MEAMKRVFRSRSRKAIAMPYDMAAPSHGKMTINHLVDTSTEYVLGGNLGPSTTSQTDIAAGPSAPRSFVESLFGRRNGSEATEVETQAVVSQAVAQPYEVTLPAELDSRLINPDTEYARDTNPKPPTTSVRLRNPSLANDRRHILERLDEDESRLLADFRDRDPTFHSQGVPAFPLLPALEISSTTWPTLAEDENTALRINQNLQLAQDEQMFPSWYIKNPPVHHNADQSYLCPTCRHIDLEWIFEQEEPRQSVSPEEYIYLGTLTDILKKPQCSLCRLVGATVLLDHESQQFKATEHHTAASDPLRNPQDLNFESKYYLTPCVYNCDEYGRGYQVFLRRDLFDNANGEALDNEMASTTHLSPSYPLGIRLLTDDKRGGRRVPRNHMDFAWVKGCIQLCELNTVTPESEFSHPIRAIDTTDLCIVELGRYARYVALSYPWGGTKQIKLTKDSRSRYQHRNSLLQQFDEIPRTLQDSIILVSKIGERYLWVDSLCIVQDDENDVEQQLKQMGAIYRGSLLTIHAVCGQDAAHGLPGVRPRTRNVTQIVEQVGDLTVANILPWLEETELKGSWSTRAWTFQERALSQRHLMVADDGVIFNCWHTYSPEDEYCRHALEKEPEGLLATARGRSLFFAGLDKRCTPYPKKTTPFDHYAMLVSEYTQRHLTFQTDAVRAFQGILDWLRSDFGRQFVHGLPETELDAALLWSPIGSCTRRRDPESGNCLFPSWSWLGWIGHAAYPWTVEREYFMSTVHSPLVWRNVNAAQPHPRWFTTEDICFPQSDHREKVLALMRKEQEDHLGVCMACDRAQSKANIHPSFRWPSGQLSMMQYVAKGSHLLCFHTLSATFKVLDTVRQRTKHYNMQHKIFRLRVYDDENYSVGYIDIPDPKKQPTGENLKNGIVPGLNEFVVLSRSTISSFEPAPDPLDKRPRPTLYSQQDMESRVDPRLHASKYTNGKGCFDTRAYDVNRPWCLFNVMMIRREGDVVYRSAIGRIHVDAFLYANAMEKVITLE